MKKLCFALIFAGLCFFETTGCAPPAGRFQAPSVLGPEAVGILGGEKVSAHDPLASSVVGLYDSQKDSKCTGSLIADDIILTAAHCVEPGSKTQIIFGTEFFASPSQTRPSLKVLRHPDYNSNRPEGVDTHDLALVSFSGGLPSGWKAIALSSHVDQIGSSKNALMAFGFGVSNGFFGTGSGTLRKASLQFLQMHSETEFRTAQEAQGVCSGDSGGPLIEIEKDQILQVGVASRVATKFLGCRQYAVYTRVDVYKDWILEASQKLRQK